MVPADRFTRWVENFLTRHGATSLTCQDGLSGAAEDGSWFEAMPPFEGRHPGPATVDAFLRSCLPPEDWGVVLVRRGGFAVARMAGERMVSSKVGQRHVQGQTKAGGQSQQRFARRRDNQARAAWEAAAGHARAHLATLSGPVAVGGDAAGVAAVLELAGLTGVRVHQLGAVAGFPRRAALEDAVGQALGVVVRVHNE